MAATNNYTIKDWQKHCEYIHQATHLALIETKAEKQARIKTLQKDYTKFLEYYFPHLCSDEEGNFIPPADFHLKIARKIKRSKKLKALLELARAHAKSTTAVVLVPIWLLIQEQPDINFGVVCSKSEDAAKRLIADLQAELEFNQRLINDFGVFKGHGSWEDGEFTTAQGKKFLALGRGQSPRGLKVKGKRPDYIVVDDFDDDEIVNNPARMAKAIKWLLEALFPTVSPLEYRFIVVGNRIHKNSAIAQLAAKKQMWHIKVNALTKDGVPSWPALYSLQDIIDMIEFMGYYSSQKELFNNPIQEGNTFKEEWIKWGKVPPLHTLDKIILYGDMSYRAKGDFKALKVWGRKGKSLYKIKAFNRQCDITEATAWLYDFYESLPENVVVTHYVEGNFIQDSFVNDFDAEGEKRGYFIPIIADKRKKPDKYLRIEQTSAYYSRGNVIYNIKEKDDPDMQRAVDHLLAFEKGSGAPDDSPDADEGAIHYLMKGLAASKFEPRKGIAKHWAGW